MDADVVIRSVKTDETRNGNTRWTVTDDSGGEYTTFRPAIGQAAEQAEGKRARLSFHEEERNGFRNVYLDGVEILPDPAASPDIATDSDPEEAAWRTAVDAAPWLVGESEPHEAIPPDELYDKLKPFKNRVAEDIKDGDDQAT